MVNISVVYLCDIVLHSQFNAKMNNWVEFFITQRLEKQYELALNSGMLTADLRVDLDLIHLLGCP